MAEDCGYEGAAKEGEKATGTGLEPFREFERKAISVPSRADDGV
jgi:hypothetical protein